MAQWSVNIRRLVDDIYEGEVAPAIRDYALQALDGVLRLTPVDTGRARGAWFVSLDTPSGQTSNTEYGDGGAAAAAAQARGRPVIARARPGQQIIIENNVEYAVLLEQGPLNYGQFRSGAPAPARMVDRTVQRLAGE